MGLIEYGINLTILFLVINASLFMLLPNANPETFSCLTVLQPGLNNFSGGKTVTGSCVVAFISQPNIAATDTVTNQPNPVLSTIANLGNILGVAIGTVLYIFNLLAILVYLLFSVLYLGWRSVYNILFISAPGIAPIFFVIGCLITAVQLVSTFYLLADAIFKIRGLNN